MLRVDVPGEDEEPVLAAYCPDCAEREFGLIRRMGLRAARLLVGESRLGRLVLFGEAAERPDEQHEKSGERSEHADDDPRRDQ